MNRNKLIFSIVLLTISFLCSGVADQTESDCSKKDKARIKSIIEVSEPVIWLFTGNSITQGAKHTHGMRSYSEIFAERIRWELQRTSDFVINTAISGHTTKNLLDDFDKRIKHFNPKVVFLMVGTNDASKDKNVILDQFGNNLILLIEKIRKIGAVPVLLTPNIIIAEKAYDWSNIYSYILKTRDVAEDSKVILVDNWHLWETELQTKYEGKVHRRLLNDPLHPNGYGHQEIAKALFKELSIFDHLAATCGGHYYEGEH